MNGFKGFVVFIVTIAIIAAACSTAPITGRRQLSLVSGQQEAQLGLTTFDQMKKDTPVSKDPTANAMLQRVGKKIAAAAAKDLPDAQWEFVVFDSKEMNAFCLPGGKIGVYSGILPVVKDDAGLATVLGHEVAHAAAHHGGERMSQEMAAQGVGEFSQLALSSTKYSSYAGAFSSLYPGAAQVLVLLPFSRKQESEADRIGLHYMARAGYNPEAAVSFWERFSAATGGKDTTPTFLRTHPVDAQRIADIKKYLFEAKQEYHPQ
jgi:predicted Zn-dependent protease